MLLQIHHAGITVSSLDRSLELYRDVLGLEVLMVFERTEADIGRVVGYPGARLRIAFLQVPGDTARIELLQYLTPEGVPQDSETYNPGAGHVCFRVSDIHALYERVAAAGLHVRSDGPIELTEGPNRGTLALYFRDPDGYTIELFQPPASTL